MGINRMQSISAALLVVLLFVGCHDGDGSEELPTGTVIVHNERPWDLTLDSGAWVLDVPANGSASVAVWPGQWAVLCVWADGVGQTQIWAVTDSEPRIEWIVHDDSPPTWSYVP